MDQGNIKEVKWIFVGIKRDEIVNLQWGISIAVDNSKNLARVIIKIFGHGGSDLFVGDIGEAEDRFERIATRLGAVDLLAEEGDEPLPAEEAGQVIAALVEQLATVREAAAAVLRGMDFDGQENYIIHRDVINDFQVIIEGGEGVDDG